MSKIDVSQWKEFKLTNLFEPHHGKRLTKRDRVSGDVPFLTAGFDNQGVKGYLAGNFEIWHNPISIDMFGNCFYHEYDCAGDDNVYALVNNDMASNSKLFITGVLNKQLSIQFSYKDQFRQHDLDMLSIKLPVNSFGNPDWHYMDEYIAKRAVLVHKYVSELAKAKDKSESLNVTGWKEFKIGDLLTKVKTKKVPFKALDLPVNPTDNCDLPLVAAGVDNQGRGRYVDSKYATVLHGCLTVSANGANSGATFYQDSDFSILQDAYALELVDKYKSMGMDNIYLFLAAVIQRGLINNDWSNKATWTRVQKTSIKLPVTSSDEPDWRYMDEYVAFMKSIADRHVGSFQSIIKK